jgi:hypothetical protein
MRLLRSFAVALTLGLVLPLSIPAPAAAVPLDTPTVSVVDIGLFEVTMRVKAGPSGAPAGFGIEWMKKSDYVAFGGWPTDYGTNLVYCIFNGTPTLNLWGASTFLLGPGQEALVQPGDLFDETGIETNYLDGLPPGTDFVFRAYAAGGPGGDMSAYSPTLLARTSGSPECTQGFWKNHEDVWPPSCTPMLLGTVLYTKQQLLDIFNQPAVGNGLISLAHQLIAAKLNLCNGSLAAPIAATITAADAMIGGLVVPPVGSGFLNPAATDPLTEQLDKYNNGKLGGVIDCPTAVRSNATWGRLKTLYR